MADRWEHTRWCSTLYRGEEVLGVTWPSHDEKRWAAYSEEPGLSHWGRIGYFPTRACAMRAVASATDPRKGHFLG